MAFCMNFNGTFDFDEFFFSACKNPKINTKTGIFQLYQKKSQRIIFKRIFFGTNKKKSTISKEMLNVL